MLPTLFVHESMNLSVLRVVKNLELHYELELSSFCRNVCTQRKLTTLDRKEKFYIFACNRKTKKKIRFILFMYYSQINSLFTDILINIL